MMPFLKLQIRPLPEENYLAEPSRAARCRAWILRALSFLAGCLVVGVGMGLMLAGCRLITRNLP